MMKAVYLEAPVTTVNDFKVVEIPRPVVKKGYVIVKVKVAAANPADKASFGGFPLAGWNFPLVPGIDFAGIVDEVGDDVTNVRPGDDVLGINWNSGNDDPEPFIGGAYAEYLLIAAYKLVKKPERMSFETAASLGCVCITAYQTIVEIGKVQNSSKLLILGGSTAVGTVAMQLAKKHLGAHVIVTSSTRAFSYVDQFHAADKIINYNQEKWEDELNGKEFDVILDCVGEPQALERAISHSVLKSNGKFVSIANFSIGMNPAGHPPLSFAAFYGAHQDSAQITIMTDLVDREIIQIPIEESFSFTTDGVQRMLGKVFEGKSLGKNLLLVHS